MSLEENVKYWRAKAVQPAANKTLQYMKILLVAGLFVVLFFLVPLGEVVAVLKATHRFYFAFGLLLGFLTIYLKSVRLGFLTRTQNMSISVNRLFIVNLVVKFYLLFLPGAVIGSGIRWGKISNEGDSVEALAAVTFNRVVDSIFIVLTGGFWFLLYNLGLDKLNWITTAGLFISTALIWILLFTLARELDQGIDDRVTAQKQRLQRGWLRVILSKILLAGCR